MHDTVASGMGLRIALHQTGPIPLDAEIACRPGELLALVGPSGAGKSTILRAIAGLYRPAHGLITCGGETWVDTQAGVFVPPHRRAIGMVFQSYALFPHMTASANIMAAMGHLPRVERPARARELLSLVNLSGLEGRRPAELSGGQQQRVAVARALAREPKVLLLDEPFSAVDKVTRGKLYRELAELWRSLAIPIVLVTHDFDEAARLADRMCLLHHGRVVQAGTPQDVLARPATVEAARLVDLKNLFEATIRSHDGEETILDWCGDRIVVRPSRTDLPIGSRVAWAVPSTQVILDRADGRDHEGVNRLSATVVEVAALSEATSILVEVAGAAGRVLSMTVPAQFVRRTRMVAGAPVEVSIRPDGIHLMASGASA
ncbi:ABC transporter ATP-binding protein [Bosea sp. 124]|uniref:ABC transporter ATP-binding protein n=1 Tax=Bosea sp. 124 TaxID=2135642 RepID=UPI000D357F0E|nr:ABC transporter ATP-binding protein [Bosea sp. 124]PTM41532.1 molybdate transport system ATP-binding protein [Bosea sp. 124]